MIRAIRGEKLPPNPFALTDASGVQLASALKERRRIVIDAGDERFEFHRSPAFPRRNGGAPLGSVGKEGRFSAGLTADLPPEVPEWLQAFLFAIVYDESLVNNALVSASN